MKNNIHFFSRNSYIKDKQLWEKLGIRGKEAMGFAALDLPILPGFIIDSKIAAHLENEDVSKSIKTFIKKCEKITGKVFGDTNNPLLVKIVISPNLAIVNYPALHNFGLTDNTISGFTDFVGEDFGYHEILFQIKGFLQIEQKIAELQKKSSESKALLKKITDITKYINSDIKAEKIKKIIAEFKKQLPDDFYSDVYKQLEIVLKRISFMLSLDELDDDDAALIVQPMVYGNYGKDSASGMFFTRDVVTGEDKLSGWFDQNKFNSIETKGKDILKIGSDFLKDLIKVARIVEDHFKEIRAIRFTIENGRVWLIDQRPLMSKSTQSDIKCLLALYNRKVITKDYLINAVKPEQLNEILHPIINPSSVKGFKSITGGVPGAPGAAIGRVYFTTNGLIDAYKVAQQKGLDTRLILCMNSTFAEDVKAIEVATGVLSAEGGYAAHASVVARQYGKISLVADNLKVTGNKATIDGKILKEGDIITLNVPHYGDPNIFFGEANLIEPDPVKSGLLEFVKIIKSSLGNFHVRVNADKARDASLAIKFGAEGIGLCRTEHMFFDSKRINVFRRMIISDTFTERVKALKKLKAMQKDDFYQLFKVMDGKEVTIRLLDAPLHEFLPHNKDEMQLFIDFMKNEKNAKNVTVKEINENMDNLREFNPMLGHRGCRIAVSYPEIYEMQMEAIFEALYKLKGEGVKVKPEIMIPLIMNEDELKLIIFGKKIEGQTYKGLKQIEIDLRKKLKAPNIPYRFGTMIELPVAALAAGEIAKYADFFSFGTNDLTQTTIGLSRDDYTSFMPDYTLFDIIDGNPFIKLNKHVKELVQTAVRRGSMTRPGLTKGLCGEHGAVPENIKFCMSAGLDYVSCSVYSVPIALLAVAQETNKKT
jgi:pyruvate, orthophosphate dikinase